MGGFRFSSRNVIQVVGAVAFFIAWVGHKSGLLPDVATLALIAVFVIAAGFAVWQALSLRKVARERAVAARALGWRLRAEEPSYAQVGDGFPFNHGRDRTARLVAAGAHKWTFGAIFTLQFTQGLRRFSHTQEYTVILVELMYTLPDVYIIPKDSVETAKVLAGVDRSTFELAEFNDNWSVTGPDKRFVHGMVHPLLIDALQQFGSDATPICIADGAIYTWSAKRLGARESIEAFTRLLQVRKAIPEYLWPDFGGPRNRRLATLYGQDLDVYFPEHGMR